mgnify:CR=1 FL=1
MGAFSKLPDFFGRSLVAVAKEHNYSEANILILEGKLDELKASFPGVYYNLTTCSHHRDRRTPLEYAQDLVASWLFEDYVCEGLNINGLRIRKAGADSNRAILANSRVSSSSDTIVSCEGAVERKLEIMTDYGSYWSRYGCIDLRDGKYQGLCNSASLFLGFSTDDKKYILMDFSKAVNEKYIPSHYPYGGKPAYQIPCDGLLFDFTFDKVSKTIRDILLVP